MCVQQEIGSSNFSSMTVKMCSGAFIIELLAIKWDARTCHERESSNFKNHWRFALFLCNDLIYFYILYATICYCSTNALRWQEFNKGNDEKQYYIDHVSESTFVILTSIDVHRLLIFQIQCSAVIIIPPQIKLGEVYLYRNLSSFFPVFLASET